MVKSHFESADGGNSVRLEGLGCAVANVVAVANLLASSGVVLIRKVKSKEKMIPYEHENGRMTERPTTHIKFDLVKSPGFEADQARPSQAHLAYRKTSD